MLSGINQHCLFYGDPAHHYLREWREPKPSLQWGPPQSQVLSSNEGATQPGRKPWVSATTPDQSPYAPAAEHTPHSLWGRRGWRKPQRQTGRETWGAHRRRGMLKEERKRNALWDFLLLQILRSAHMTIMSITSSTATSIFEINWNAVMDRNWTVRNKHESLVVVKAKMTFK